MGTADFKNKMKVIGEIASKHKWTYISCDSNCGRISYKDELAVFRIDIFTSKMTVCLLHSGDKPVYKKRQSIESIEAIFKNPYDL